MKEKKQLTLQTSYQTLLKHVWKFKKNSCELDKQNAHLKGKISCTKEFNLDTSNFSKESSKRKSADLKQRIAYMSQPPSKGCLDKFERLKQRNLSLKEELLRLEEEWRAMTDEVYDLDLIRKQIRRIEHKLKKSNNRIASKNNLKKKQDELGHRVQSSESDTEFMEDKMRGEEEKQKWLMQKRKESYARTKQARKMEKKMGRQIIDLIESKNGIRRQIKIQREGEGLGKQSLVNSML